MFHEDWIDLGWIVGVAGGFSKKLYTANVDGNTFSNFVNFNDKTPLEHFESIIGLLSEYYEKEKKIFS